MSEEIKYEAVFGDQALFDGTMGDCEFASEEYGYKFANGALYYCERYNEKAGWALSCKSHLTFKPSAMRRIIRTPTWTVADQKAGKFPPIGSKYLAGSDKREFTCLFHGKGNGTVSVIGFNSDDEVTGYQVQYCYPIESPEEKAARLREEWCIKALSSCSILSGMQKYELKRLSGYIEDIYDALLSGELAAPKGGE